MKILKIICDRCGAEIEGNPYRIYVNELDRESEDIVGTVIVERDFCGSCASIISQDIMYAMEPMPEPVKDTETEPGTEFIAESEPEGDKPEAEPEAEEPVNDLSETRQKPEPETKPEPQKPHAGGIAKGTKLLTKDRKEHVRQMVIAGMSDYEIARELDMPVERISVYVNKTGYRGLISDKPGKPKLPSRTTASRVTFGV